MLHVISAAPLFRPHLKASVGNETELLSLVGALHSNPKKQKREKQTQSRKKEIHTTAWYYRCLEKCCPPFYLKRLSCLSPGAVMQCQPTYNKTTSSMANQILYYSINIYIQTATGDLWFTFTTITKAKDVNTGYWCWMVSAEQRYSRVE